MKKANAVPGGKTSAGPRVFRDNLQPPRAAQFIAALPGKLRHELIEPFIVDVWLDLMRRLFSPVVQFEDDEARHVVFLESVCYSVGKLTGTVGNGGLAQTADGVEFVNLDCSVAFDPPLHGNLGWLEHYLELWSERMAALQFDPAESGAAMRATTRKLFRLALLRSIWWRRMRQRVREAIALDPRILAWCRAGRSRHAPNALTNWEYNRTLAHRDAYEQIERDEPGLVWLYTLMLDEGVKLPPGEAVAGMKAVLQRRGVTPAGWRLLAGGREQDFRHVRDWIGPDGELAGRLGELRSWLRFLVALRRSTPLPGAVRNIFLHDCFEAGPPGRVRLRNVWLDARVVKTILAEAERRLAQGNLQAFARGDLVDVVTWLEAEQPEIDKNQRRAGWKHLAARAARWKADKEAAGELAQHGWASSLPTTVVGPWTVVPITDAWALRQEAVRQHHCADRYLKGCVAGAQRMFAVRNAAGRPVATIGIERGDERWESFGIKRSCNRAADGALVGLDHEIARRYTDLWRLEEGAVPSREEVPSPCSHVHFEEDESVDCLYCAQKVGTCEAHVLAVFDVSKRILVDGAIANRFEAIRGLAWRAVLLSVEAGLRPTGLGAHIDALVSDLGRDCAAGTLRDEAVAADHRGRLDCCVLDLLLDQTELATFYRGDGNDDESPGEAPVESSLVRYYIAAAPRRAIALLEERLTDSFRRLEALAATRPPQATAPVAPSGSRRDPMRPAADAYERAILDMFSGGPKP